MKPLFLDDYEAATIYIVSLYLCAEFGFAKALFATTPVFIGEYHAPHVPVGQDRPGNICGTSLANSLKLGCTEGCCRVHLQLREKASPQAQAGEA